MQVSITDSLVGVKSGFSYCYEIRSTTVCLITVSDDLRKRQLSECQFKEMRRQWHFKSNMKNDSMLNRILVTAESK